MGKWWFLSFGILAAAALVGVTIVVFGPSFDAGSSTGAIQKTSDEEVAVGGTTGTASTPAQRDEPSEAGKPSGEARCTAPSRKDYVCAQERYRELVRNSGVEAAFAALQGEMATDESVGSECHLMTHFIGRAAAEVYGDIPKTYAQGDSLCGSGYYHGAMEAVVEEVGPEEILEEADTLCADLGGGYERRSFHHYNCAHGLGHGFMNIMENDLPGSLRTCDSLADGWERERCYGGVFMENVVAEDNPAHPSQYLDAGRPLYPCDALEDQYKNECYQRQSSYALEKRGNDFAEVFGLCEGVEAGFRPACYQGLGWDASVQSIKRGADAAGVNESTAALCMLGGDLEARSNCVLGAVDYFIRHHYDDAPARTFCESLDADLSASCLREAEEYSVDLRSPRERRTA